MTALKSARTLAASLGVLAFGALAATPAQAFDNVHWNWQKDIDEDVDIDVDIDINLVPTGLVEIEKLQIFFGDLCATSVVSHITNNQPDTDGGGTFTVPIDQLFQIVTSTDDSTDPSTVLPGQGTGGGLTLDLTDGTLDEGTDVLTLNFHLTGEFEGTVDPTDSFDALTELPEVVSKATAVANNQSITSDVPVYLHDGQFVAGGFTDFSDASRGEVTQAVVGLVLGGLGFAAYDDNNLHTALALGFIGLGIGNIVDPAQIHAYSAVYCIENATVESAATAVANNISVTLASDTPDNHNVIGDITQVAIADVSAASFVSNVQVNNYTNLGVLDRPLVSSLATAVGNNVSITVGPVAP